MIFIDRNSNNKIKKITIDSNDYKYIKQLSNDKCFRDIELAISDKYRINIEDSYRVAMAVMNDYKYLNVI